MIRNRPLFAFIGACCTATVGYAISSREPSEPSLACRSVTAVYDITGIAYYVDGRRSVRDAKLFDANRRAVRNLDDYHKAIGALTDAGLGGDKRAARCAVANLMRWVDGKALLGLAETRQARSQRRWSGAAMSITSLKLWPFLGADEKRRVKSYLAQLSSTIAKEATADRVKNNHLYWAAVTYRIAGILGQVPRYSNDAVQICRAAINSLTVEGSLPLEDIRGSRSVEYNGFALFPLSIVATLGQDPSCLPSDLFPLAAYIKTNSTTENTRFMRWAPILGIHVDLTRGSQFYAYGGGDLAVTARSLREVRGTI